MPRLLLALCLLARGVAGGELGALRSSPQRSSSADAWPFQADRSGALRLHAERRRIAVAAAAASAAASADASSPRGYPRVSLAPELRGLLDRCLANTQRQIQRLLPQRAVGGAADGGAAFLGEWTKVKQGER